MHNILGSNSCIQGYVTQAFRESQEIFGSWLSWLFLFFLLWSNSKLSPRVTSWLSRLFLEYNSRFSEKAKNLRAFPGFSEPNKAWKSQESQEPRGFLGSPGFFLQGQLTYRKILPNLVDSSLCVGFQPNRNREIFWINDNLHCSKSKIWWIPRFLFSAPCKIENLSLL